MVKLTGAFVAPAFIAKQLVWDLIKHVCGFALRFDKPCTSAGLLPRGARDPRATLHYGGRGCFAQGAGE